MELVELPAPEDDVVELTQQLIRIDSSNFGPSDETVGEAEVAEFCAHALREAGWEPEVFTTTSDARRGVVLRVPGTDPTAPALLVHGHLDVVPAVASDWTHDPFGGDIDDGFVWGRGAVDMKNTDAMMLAVVRAWGRTGVRPRRDIVLMLLPDEEAGGVHGAHWLVEHRPELFAGVTEAVGEVGGFSVTLPDGMRLYPIQTAEKGMRWLTIKASGRAGHGSMLHHDNAVTAISEAVSRIGRHTWPERRTATVDRFLDGLAEAYGLEAGSDPEALLQRLGVFGMVVGATMRNTANPTMLRAGYKHNVIPGTASAAIDGRVVPGLEAEFDETIRELVGPDIEVEIVHGDPGIEAPLEGRTVELMASVLREADPDARPLPYMMSGGTDAKAFSRLGIAGYGFSPVRMPAGLDYWRLFHGVDERVPIDGLQFGVQVLERFLRDC